VPFQRSAHVSAGRFQFEEKPSAPRDASSDTENAHARQSSLDERHRHRRDVAPHFPRSPTQRKPVQAVVAAEAAASAATSELVLRALLAAAGVWDLSAVPSAPRASAAAELEIAHPEPAISLGGPLRGRGWASQRHGSPVITLQARA
jgi:hypothetical protein